MKINILACCYFMSCMVLISSFSVGARNDYKILMLNTPTITIGGRELKVNEMFDPSDNVEWTSPRQAMKVLDSENGIQRLVVAEQYTRSRVTTVRDFMVKNNHLSSRDGAPDNPVALGSMLDDTFYLADSLMVCSDMKTDDQRFFYVSFDYGGEEINKRITCHDGDFYITRDIFSIDGNPISPFDARLAVYYYDGIEKTVTLVTDRMRLIVVPENLEVKTNE